MRPRDFIGSFMDFAELRLSCVYDHAFVCIFVFSHPCMGELSGGMGTPMQKELERPLFFSVAGILPGSLSGVALDKFFRSDGFFPHSLKNPRKHFFVAQASKKDAKTLFLLKKKIF